MKQAKEPAMKLPDAELDIMMVLWSQPDHMPSSQIMAALEGKKSWGLTTVLNFLSRLTDRGFIRVEKVGRANRYHVVVSQEEYLKEANASFLKKLHGNSVRHLIASLYDNHTISDHDLLELRRYIDEKEKQKGDIPHWLL